MFGRDRENAKCPRIYDSRFRKRFGIARFDSVSKFSFLSKRRRGTKKCIDLSKGKESFEDAIEKKSETLTVKRLNGKFL